MPRGTDEVFAAALNLPVEARAELARSLLASLEGEDQEWDPREVEAAWRAEIARRVAQIDSGEVELIPGDVDGDQPNQRTEAVVGPYELQDFHLYYTSRLGYLPTKVAFLAYCSWRDRSWGRWPDIPEGRRHQYTIGEIKHWLSVFLWRFFQISQFKRSCVPNAPKVGSGGSLSPRGDYRAPSDSEARIWLEHVARIPDGECDEGPSILLPRGKGGR
jgi:hypothetical protein